MPSSARKSKFHDDTSTEIKPTGRVRIERAITADNYGGAPWVPEGSGWHLVRALPGWRHEWRRISIVDSDTQQTGD